MIEPYSIDHPILYTWRLFTVPHRFDGWVKTMVLPALKIEAAGLVRHENF
jgi:hypothetical protein